MQPSSNDKSATSFLRGLLSLLSLSQVAAFLDLYDAVRHWWPGNSDPYEIFDYDASLELRDAKGETAVFRKRQRVKFLQDNIIAFEDYAWGDGDVFAEYKCSPGVVADHYREGDRWNILISLRESKSKGEVEEFHIENTVRNGFLEDEEWMQTEIRRRTRRLRMSIIFPKKRRCKRAILQQRTHLRVTELGQEHFRNLPDGRQLLSWETNQVRPYDIYTIRWQW